MRVVIEGKPHDPFTPAQEKEINLFRDQPVVEGVVLSADEATRLYVRGVKRVFTVMTVLVLLLSIGIALVAEPADRAIVFAWVGICVAALALFYFLSLRRRTSKWRADLRRRRTSLPAEGSVVRVDPANLAVSGNSVAWSALTIDTVEFRRISSKYRTLYMFEHLLIGSPAGPIALDVAMIGNGHFIVGTAWRRLRAAHPD
jgi:hypothetical protein